MNCVVCGAELVAGARFCPACGITVESGESACGPGRCCPKCLAPLDPERSECALCACPIVEEIADEEAIRQPYAWMECHGGHAREGHDTFPSEEPSAFSRKQPLSGCGAPVLPGRHVRSLRQILAIFCGVFLALIGLGAGAWLMLVGGAASARHPPQEVSVANQAALPPGRVAEVHRAAPVLEPLASVEAGRPTAHPELLRETSPRDRVAQDEDRKPSRHSERDEEYIRKMKQQLAEQLKEMHRQ